MRFLENKEIRIFSYALIAVVPLFGALALNTGHNFGGFIIELVIVAVGLLAALRGMRTVDSVLSKILFGLPAGLNAFILLFTAVLYTNSVLTHAA